VLKLIMYTIIWVIGLIVLLLFIGFLNYNLHFGKTTNLYVGIIAVGGYITLTVYSLSKIGKIGVMIYYVLWVIALPIILQNVHTYCIEHNIRYGKNDLIIVITFLVYIATTTILPLILWPGRKYDMYTTEAIAKIAAGGIFSLPYYAFVGIGQGILMLLRFLGLIIAGVFELAIIILSIIGSIIGWSIAIMFIIIVIGIICH